MRGDRAIRRRVGDAREHEAVAHLVIIKERLIRLVDRAGNNLARARGARARAARVRQVNALLLTVTKRQQSCVFCVFF